MTDYITIKVKAGAKENRIVKDGDSYKVSTKAAAMEGRANAAVIKILSKFFGRKAVIVKGHKSKNKLIKIESFEKK